MKSERRYTIIYLTNVQVEKWNSNKLCNLPTEFSVFDNRCEMQAREDGQSQN